MALVRQPTIKTLFLLPVLVGAMALLTPAATNEVEGVSHKDKMILTSLATLVWLLPAFIVALTRSRWRAARLCFVGYAATSGMLAFEADIGLLTAMHIPVVPIAALIFGEPTSWLSAVVALSCIGGILYALVGAAFACTFRLTESPVMPAETTSTSHPG
jgi:hypothetical protein